MEPGSPSIASDLPSGEAADTEQHLIGPARADHPIPTTTSRAERTGLGLAWERSCQLVDRSGRS